MKVLFLDIDGVLNNESTKEKFQEGIFKGFNRINARLKKLWLDWLEGKDILVVLSSTWRNHEGLLEALKEEGIHWIDTTPNIGFRGKEIEEWMKGKIIEAYAILDDTQQFYSQQFPHFVQTSYIHGLRPKDLKRLEKILDA